MQFGICTTGLRTAKNGRMFLGTWLVLALMLALTPTLHAQYDTGSVLGEIHDATGAVLPGTTVTALNKDTGATFTTVTGDSGQYEIPSLRTGSYKITAAHAGFSTAVADNVTVSVGVRLRIALTLQVGQASATTVEVSGVALQLDTESSERGQTVTGYQTEAFPLVGRNYSDLLALVVGARQAPTAATTSSVSSLLRQGAYNVNGQRSMFNNFMLDGMDNNAYGESNQGFDNQIVSIPPDSVVQWNVVTNNENAEYGRASGATINVASANGTNAFHTTLYEFVRNTDFNAAGFFKPTLVGTNGSTPFQKPVLHRNQFGLNFGGPILKDKLFYFVDYEGLRANLSPLYTLTLPTQNELNGILVVPVTNPLTGVAYPAGTAIPASAMNSLSSSILTYFKTFSSQLPVSGSATTGLATYDYAKEVPFTDKFDKGDLRLDYHQDASNSWFLRISDRKETGVNNPTIPLPLDGQTNGTIRVLDQQVALGYTRLWGSNKVIDVRLGLSRTKAGKWTKSIGANNFSIPGLPTSSDLAGGLPAIGINNFTGFGRLTSSPQWQNPAVIDPKVNFTWLRGHHSLKFGYEYEHIWMAVNDNNPLYGQFTFGGHYSGGTSTAADAYWADFLFGLTSTYQLANYYVAHLEQSLHNVYAQDDWKITPSLTLNLGLRWEYGSPYSELHNRVSNFDPGTQTVLTTTPGVTAGNGLTPVSAGGVYGKTLVNPDLTDVMPRVGFAWNVLPKTVIRGGFGTGYIHYTRAGSGDILPINAPQAQFASVIQPTPTASNHCNPLPVQIIATGSTTPSCYVTIDQGFSSGLVPPQGASVQTMSANFNPATDNITWINKNRKDAYVENAFFSVEQQMTKNTVLDVAYVFNHGVHLEGFVNGNQKNPSNGFARPFSSWPSDITEALNEFYSNFNALQVKYEQRFVGGLTLLNSFTWEHSLDNASASLEGNTPSPQDANNIKADYAQSDYNLPVANVTSLVYELPLGHGRRFASSANGLLNTIIGDWQLSAINTMQAGTPFNITYSPGTAQAVSPQITNSYRGANLYRPYRVPGVPVTQGRGNRAANTGYVNYVNPAAFLLQPAKDFAGNTLSPFGTSSRNPGRTPAYYNTDFDLVKKFNTPFKTAKIEFRAEAYNMFNHTNLYLPSTISGSQGATTSTIGTGGSVTLGQITPTTGVVTGGGQVSSTFQPRVLQFGLKVIY
jgi:hypothetical protein